ncbi:class I SAM-dependent methyltransferase [Candidatus Parcubacteria bacterium]|nr:class I SAM-dependent methyltransferase [Candidatus Parcubacteria bacterium]
MKPQIDAKHYFSKEYNHKARWLSYWYQVDMVLGTELDNILEIGIGSGIVRDYLLKVKKTVRTLDIDSNLNPEFIGSVENIPMDKESVDCVLAAEILEHLPFEKFNLCLKEIFRVSRKWAIISLPDSRSTFCNFYLKTPFLSPLKLFIKISGFKKHKFNGQHYWEPGKKGYSFKKVESEIISAGWEIIKSFTPYDVPTKHFYLLKKVI